MTQAIVCSSDEGLVLATDSLALHELEGGQVQKLTERKLYALGARAAILAAGAAAGARLSAGLSQWLEGRNLIDVADVMAVSRDFLAEGYVRYLREAHEGHCPAPRHLSFVIGGFSADHASSPYQAVLLHSEAGELPFTETRLGRVFALPRRLIFEARTTRQIAEGIGLLRLAEVARAELEGAAERNPQSVGGPFHVALVTAAGVQFLQEATDAGR